MTIDTKIRHITKPGANLFLELGFDPADAARFHTESQQRINDTEAIEDYSLFIEKHGCFGDTLRCF
jgi:hypothetical protein